MAIRLLENGEPCGLSLLALGKCGGRELGFASDIELMFVYAGNGKTNGAEAIDHGRLILRQLVRSVINTMQTRQEGIFQIDLQLRPYGKAGSMAVPFGSFRRILCARWSSLGIRETGLGQDPTDDRRC